MEYVYDEYDLKVDNNIHKLKNEYAGGLSEEINDLIKYHQDQIYYLKKSILSVNLKAPIYKKETIEAEIDK